MARASSGIAATNPDRVVSITSGITSGSSPQQVERLLGKPKAKHGRCWQYPTKTDKYWVPYGVKKTIFDVCFFAGVVTDTATELYVLRDGKFKPFHVPAPKLP